MSSEGLIVEQHWVDAGVEYDQNRVEPGELECRVCGSELRIVGDRVMGHYECPECDVVVLRY